MVDFVWERSAGNAFIVEELVNSVHAEPEPAVPDSVRDLVRHRMHVLPPAAQHVARALAIGDEPVSHALLESVLEEPEPELLDALYAAVRAGLVSVADSGDGYRIRHGIMREVLADELLPGQRIRLHRRYAEAIESSGERDSAPPRSSRLTGRRRRTGRVRSRPRPPPPRTPSARTGSPRPSVIGAVHWICTSAGRTSSVRTCTSEPHAPPISPATPIAPRS